MTCYVLKQFSVMSNVQGMKRFRTGSFCNYDLDTNQAQNQKNVTSWQQKI